MMKIKTIIYDFDGTLTPYSVPQYEIITKCQVTIPEFMNQVIQKAKQESRPLIESYLMGSTFCQEKGKEDKILLSMEKETKNKFIRQIVNEQGEGKSIVYIGDGLTDKPAFQEMKKWGGTSIYVYHTKEDKINAEKLKKQKLIDYAFWADFTQGAELERWINSNTKEEV